MFAEKSDDNFTVVQEGIALKTRVHGHKTLLAEFRLKKGNTLPTHTHPHEQTGYLVSGRLDLIIGQETFDARPGDSWCIPSDVAHGAVVLEDSVAIEVFSPVREDYLP